MRVEIITPEIERARLFSETALILARLRAEAEDGRLDEIASRGDELLRAAEQAKAGLLNDGGE